MSIPEKLKQLVPQIMEYYPQAHIDFDPLPSGVCWLDVGYGRRYFVLEYNPTRGTGVSEIFDDTPPFTGHDNAFDSIDEGIDHFKSLLADALHTEADHLPKEFALHEEHLPWNKKHE